MTRSLRFPFQIGDLGVPATSARRAVIREQIEQVLFTLPGERVGRPDFGCGVQRLVFAGASPEAAAAAEYVVSTGLRRHLTDLIAVDAVRASVEDSTLYIDILFTDRETGAEGAETFERAAEGPP